MKKTFRTGRTWQVSKLKLHIYYPLIKSYGFDIIKINLVYLFLFLITIANSDGKGSAPNYPHISQNHAHGKFVQWTSLYFLCEGPHNSTKVTKMISTSTNKGEDWVKTRSDLAKLQNSSILYDLLLNLSQTIDNHLWKMTLCLSVPDPQKVIGIIENVSFKA